MKPIRFNDPPGGGYVRADTHQQTAFLSYWRPSFLEVLAILRGKPIRIGVFGKGNPPVSLDMKE